MRTETYLLLVGVLVIGVGLFVQGSAGKATEYQESNRIVHTKYASLDNGIIEYKHDNVFKQTFILTDSFGSIVQNNLDKPFLNQMQIQNKNPDLYINLGARDYDPDIKRFLNPDPIINPRDSAYTYAKNNPYVYTDQDGNSPLAVFVAFTIGGGIGKLGADALAGNIHSFGDCVNSFCTGAIGGATAAVVVLTYGTGAGALATAGAADALVVSTLSGDDPLSTAGNMLFGAALGGAVGKLTPEVPKFSVSTDATSTTAEDIIEDAVITPIRNSVDDAIVPTVQTSSRPAVTKTSQSFVMSANPAEQQLLQNRYLEQILETLPQRSRDALTLRSSGMTFREVGEALGTGSQRAEQIYKEALEQARKAATRLDNPPLPKKAQAGPLPGKDEVRNWIKEPQE